MGVSQGPREGSGVINTALQRREDPLLLRRVDALLWVRQMVERPPLPTLHLNEV